MNSGGEEGIALIASISNTGAPTVTIAYDLTATLISGEVRTGRLLTVPDQLTINFTNEVKDYVYGSDSLVVRTYTTQIQRGGSALGRLIFGFAGTTQNDLTASGVKLSLTVRDAWNRPYSTAQVIHASSLIGEMPEYPSIHPRHIPFPVTPPCTSENTSPSQKQ
jgi:hypothetical protein